MIGEISFFVLALAGALPGLKGRPGKYPAPSWGGRARRGHPAEPRGARRRPEEREEGEEGRGGEGGEERRAKRWLTGRCRGGAEGWRAYLSSKP